jgi:glycosyltransferase involved in cell wall biosynthesis
MATQDLPQAANLPNRAPYVSVIVPVSERYDDLQELHRQYVEVLARSLDRYEMIYVIDGPIPDAEEKLRALEERGGTIRLVRLNRWFGEATALAVGFERARGDWVMTLPAYFQVEPEEITRLIESFSVGDNDLVTGWRCPRVDSRFNRLQALVFRQLVRMLTRTRLHDLSCGIRLMRKRVAAEIRLYADLHRFLPILAYQRGFKVDEVQVRQSQRDIGRRVYRPGVYLRRLLDMLTLFFIFKFTKKPLRFFGLVGSALSVVGVAITTYLGIHRILGLGPIGNRPLLILGVLLLVLGVHLFSIGLLGEIIIFTHAGQVRDYEVDEPDE